MKEQIVSFETATLAKEKGFDSVCLDTYSDEGKFQDRYNVDPDQYESLQDALETFNTQLEKYATADKRRPYIAAPTQSLLQKWLREDHKIDVLPILRTSGKYSYDIFHYENPNTTGARTRHTFMNSFVTYEEALEVGLQEALKLIDNG